MARNPFNWQDELLVDNEAQSNDATTKKVKLPRDGHIGLIDILFKCTNGATSNAGYSNGGTAGSRLEDSIDEINIIANGSKQILSVTNVEDLMAEATRITGRPPLRDITEAASGVQMLYVPIYMGRYPDDKLVVIPNGEDAQGNSFFDNLELQVKYSPTIAATDFATGTFTMTVNARKLVDNSPPESKFVKLFRKKWDYTSVASGDEPKTLTYGQNTMLRSIQVHCFEAGIDEGVDITHLGLKLKPKSGSTIEYGKYRWEALQAQNAQDYQIGELRYRGRSLCSDTDVINTYVPRPKYFAVKPQLYTLAAALATDTVVESRAGSNLTLGSWHIGDTAAAYTTDQANYWEVATDAVPRYVWIDFDKRRDLMDLIDTGKLSDATLTLTNGGAGGTVRICEEHIMSAKAFRAA